MIMQQTLHEWGPLGVNSKIERMGMKWIEKKVSDGKLVKKITWATVSKQGLLFVIRFSAIKASLHSNYDFFLIISPTPVLDLIIFKI